MTLGSRTTGSRGIAAVCSLGALLCLAGPIAPAEESAEPRAPDAAAGRVLAGTCAACHGEDGNTLLPGHPNLAGQNARYLLRQMQYMRDGRRDPKTMAGMLDALTDENLEDIAAYYASQSPKVGQASPEGIEIGEAIYRGGILDKQVAACTACHAPDGSGNPQAGFPSLTGQPRDYVIAQLTDYREGRRTTDREDYAGMMRHTAVNMTDTEIEAVANYLFGLH